MFGTRWRLFNLFGLPIYMDISWLIILVLLMGTLTTIFMETVPDLQPYQYWLLGLGAALAFFGCIVLHEMGHALVARATGTPVSGITLFVFGGVAEMTEEPTSAKAEFLMAIAGPIVSAILGGLCAIFWQAGASMDWPLSALVVLKNLFIINISVLVFNMVPAFPLDGGRVLRSILWGITGKLRQATYWAATAGQAFAWLLIGVGVLYVLSGNFWNGIWLGLIGMFLSHAARGSYQQVVMKQTLQGEPVRRFMNPNPIVAPPWIDLKHWMEDYVYHYHRKAFPVGQDGRVEGFISSQMLANYPRSEWEHHTVAEIMEHDVAPISISSQADAAQALSQMQRTGSSRLLVMEGDHLVGIVSLKDLMRFLQFKLDFESDQDEEEDDTFLSRSEEEPTEVSSRR